VTVNAARLRDLTLELVRVASPTGDTRTAAELYAERLRDLGLDVELQRDAFPATPIVVARLRGSRPGPTLVLNGHLDTVPIPHAEPEVDGDRVYGRGAADMKGALAAAAEAARVIAAEDFAGELAIVAIGLHEAPGGRGEDLTHLLANGFTADYAVVCELTQPGKVVVAHMGQATVEIEITREGMPTHELQTPAGTPHPLHAAARVLEAIRRRNDELAADEHPWVGAETYFVGELHGGDFYNRFPARARVVGTRRWAPGNTLASVESEYRDLLASVARETGCEIELDLRLVRGEYGIDPEHDLVRALQAAHEAVTGQTLEPVGWKVVADGALWSAAGIPTVYHGPVGVGAHADVEYVEVPELVRAASVYAGLAHRLLA
jgi:acetylornithine deacetylase/succinyl-diaminopimelate desuccinylase-like protein